MRMTRKIIEIDESLCDGCGDCVTACHEGALAVISGKARLVKDSYCDGLGACIGECHAGAITIVERQAEAFDEAAVALHQAALNSAATGEQLFAPVVERPRPQEAALFRREPAPHGHGTGGGCPGAAMRAFASPTVAGAAATSCDDEVPSSMLGHWPVQLMLVPPHAPFLAGADLVVCADCVPFAVPDFHARYLGGRAVVVGCPKLDDLGHYAEKLALMVRQARLRRLTVVRMEVPCCRGLVDITLQASSQPGMEFPVEEHVAGIRGAITRRIVR
jgi:Pyruvate/2-oxoacid:ferredoxin oxidoreductase delta subunit